jgi:2'-5' RNA ligase
MYDVARKFNVKGVTRQRAVPHISLYGAASTNDLRKVISEVEKVSNKYTLVPFKIKGFSYFSEPKKVIYPGIDPSPELKELRQELAARLSNISTSAKPFDRESEFTFHSTIALQDIDSKFNQIWSYIKQKEEPNINQYLLRITILGKGSKILYEYDLVLGRLLNRRQALNHYWWRRTINRLRELQGIRERKKQSLPTRIFSRLLGYLSHRRKSTD